MKTLLSILFLFTAASSAQWIKQTVNTTANFRGLSVVNQKVIWASGTGGTVIRTIDGGKGWNVMVVPGAEKLDFRDIEAFDANTAYILSIGNGESSRIYKTIDGGATWNLQFTNKNEKAFFDAIACWDSKNCIAMSDPVDNRFVLVETKDGTNWSPVDTSRMPATLEGEAAFAASGTCLIVGFRHRIFIVSGGTAARLFGRDRGIEGEEMPWKVSSSPITKGTAGSGIFSMAIHGDNAVVVGGNYEKPNDTKDTLAFTNTAGMSWTPGTGLSGYRSGVAYIDDKTIIAVGTNGTDMTTDGGKTWKKTGGEDLNAVATKGKKAVWAVGPKGMVVKLK
ncbi:MAG TPA: hypothetical protein VMZ26_10795 [Pyrinomonadaceae bacterium]|nr:hypothetical protein [Pyrinomonadaceae bacterium]